MFSSFSIKGTTEIVIAVFTIVPVESILLRKREVSAARYLRAKFRRRVNCVQKNCGT
ncbi:hypothetical protein Theba_1563 [Mesotoga prima MesG1.Ag.4.2]|uniref:Uncharacterized protein n=1 Tax=Mesotoga prima MesG1.Ag.4.2 TaxID=660470 RepID=I2F5N2_9BACT|nr:hypothetical protein Theba_1563 [Mesotoga prima MesG1.Ag.4.2]CCU83921.1 conserved hypothetical protein [Mesotoga infera]